MSEGEPKGKFKMYVLLYIIGSQKKHVRLNCLSVPSVEQYKCQC